METAFYEEGATQLEPGDTLLVYSDGLTEATNAEGEEFGAARVAALLPELRALEPEAIGVRILSEVDEFLGDARTTDDLSLIIVVRR